MVDKAGVGGKKWISKKWLSNEANKNCIRDSKYLSLKYKWFLKMTWEISPEVTAVWEWKNASSPEYGLPITQQKITLIGIIGCLFSYPLPCCIAQNIMNKSQIGCYQRLIFSVINALNDPTYFSDLAAHVRITIIHVCHPVILDTSMTQPIR